MVPQRSQAGQTRIRAGTEAVTLIQCFGSALNLNIEVRRAWVCCEVCGGLGRLMTSRAQLPLRGRVDQEFPGAAAQSPMRVLA